MKATRKETRPSWFDIHLRCNLKDGKTTTSRIELPSEDIVILDDNI